MASTSIPTILSSLSATASTLAHFSIHTERWPILSSRLLDINEGLAAASLTLSSWKLKYDIQDRRPEIYMYVLFGRTGWPRISRALSSIDAVAERVGVEADGVLDCALRFAPKHARSGDIEASFLRLLKHPSWSQKFNHSALRKSADLEFQLLRLHRKIGTLERLADMYLEIEHPDLFAPLGRRLPGRRGVVGRDGEEDVQHKLLDAVSGRKDAELLHRASLSIQSYDYENEDDDKDDEDDEVENVHIGLCVPQIHRRDFAFLLEMPQGDTHEILTHPVRIKAVHDSSRVQANMTAALAALRRNTHLDAEYHREETYLLPSHTSSSGFQVTHPPTPLLAPLSLKDPVAAIVNSQTTPLLCQQALYPQDQVALTCGIAAGCLRLLGTPWLDELSDSTVRWRRDTSGRWTAMLSSTSPLLSPSPTSHILGAWEGVATWTRPLLSCRKRVHIFRIGLLLASLTLRMPVECIQVEPPPTNLVFICIDDLGEADRVPIDAVEIAAAVEQRTNVLVGNVVGACLRVLDEGETGDVDVEYYTKVLGAVEELEALVRRVRVGGRGGAAETPRSGRGGRSSRTSVAY